MFIVEKKVIDGMFASELGNVTPLAGRAPDRVNELLQQPAVTLALGVQASGACSLRRTKMLRRQSHMRVLTIIPVQ